MTLRHWQMEKVSGSAEPLLSTTGNKGLNSSGGSNIVYDSTALFGKFSVRSKHFFDTDAAGSLSDNEFTAAFWFYVPTGTESRYIFQLGLYNTDVSLNGHTCVGLLYSYYSNKIFFTTGYKNASGGLVELGSLSRNVWHHCYISRTNSGANSTLQVKITATDGTVVHDKSEVYTKADFSIDETGTGQYSYFNGHPAGGSLTLSNGRIEDFILKNGSVLSYASIYNNSAEVFQSDEPQVSVSTGAGSATLSDSNFTGTKTYSFYDTDATTLLQSGASNSYTSYASSSVAYTALVTDDNNNRVISTFFISQGGNDMPQLLSGSVTRPLQANGEMLGGLSIDGVGAFKSLAVSSSINGAKNTEFPAVSHLMLSGAFAEAAHDGAPAGSGVSGSVIQALNFLFAKASAGDGDVVAGAGDDNRVVFWSDYSNQTIAGDADLTFDGQAFSFGGTDGTTFNVDATALTLDGTSASNLTATGANLTVSTATSGELIVNSAGVLDIDSAAAMEITSGASIDVDGVAVAVDASGGLSLDGAGAASNLTSTGQNLTISTATSGELIVNSAGTLDIDGVAVEVDASSGLSLDGAGAASNLTSTGANLTVSTATSGELIVNSAGVLDIDSASTMEITSGAAIDMDGVAVAVDASGGLSLDGTGAASNLTSTGQNLTVSTATSGELIVNSAGVLDIDSASTMEITSGAGIDMDGTSIDIDASVGLSLDAADDSNFTVAGASKSLSIINSGGGTQVLGLLSEGAGVNALALTASAGGMGLQASKAINIDSTTDSIVIGESLANAKSVLLGKASSTQISVSPNTSAASAVITLANANGTGANAISIGASAGGIMNTVKNTNGYAFEVRNSAATSLARFNGLGGADFAVSASAPRIVGSVSRLPMSTHATGSASGFALAMSSSALSASNGKFLDAGVSAKDIAMSDFPAMFMQGVDDEGKLRNYFMQISGGILQLQEGAAIF